MFGTPVIPEVRIVPVRAEPVLDLYRTSWGIVEGRVLLRWKHANLTRSGPEAVFLLRIWVLDYTRRARVAPLGTIV